MAKEFQAVPQGHASQICEMFGKEWTMIVTFDKDHARVHATGNAVSEKARIDVGNWVKVVGRFVGDSLNGKPPIAHDEVERLAQAFNRVNLRLSGLFNLLGVLKAASIPMSDTGIMIPKDVFDLLLEELKRGFRDDPKPEPSPEPGQAELAVAGNGEGDVHDVPGQAEAPAQTVAEATAPAPAAAVSLYDAHESSNGPPASGPG